MSDGDGDVEDVDGEQDGDDEGDEDAELRDERVPAATTDGTTPAEFGVRAGARLVDTLLGVAINFAGVSLAPLVVVAVTGAERAAARHGNWSSFGMGFAGALAYQICAETLGGATVGKTLFGLRVLREDATPCTMGAAFVRAVTYFVDALFVGYVAYIAMSRSPRRQRYGDRWAKAIVVTAPSVPASSARSPTAGIVVGVVAWLVCATVSSLLRLA